MSRTGPAAQSAGPRRNEHPAPPPDEAAPGPIDALRALGQAEKARWATILRIAVTESRLAGGSALALLGLAVFVMLLALVSWLLLMALVTLGLTALGLGAAAAVGTVLAVHLLAIGLAGLAARRCLADLRFDHTVAALKGPPPPPEPERTEDPLRHTRRS